MTFSQFKEEIKKLVQEQMGEQASVSLRSILKTNNLRLNGLTIMEEGRNISPTIYLESFYNLYVKGMKIEDIVDKIIDSYRSVPVSASIEMDFFKDFEKVKKRIAYRLINMEANKELLAEVPFIPYLDLAICFYYAFGDTTLGEGMILIHRSHMEMWNTDVKELFELAQENTPKLFPMDFMRLRTLLEGVLRKEEKEWMDDKDFVPLYVLTNNKRTQGSACILYPDALWEIAQKLENSFYIIPSSVHEVILIPFDERISVGTIQGMIHDVNRSQVEPDEVLSDSLYAYDFKDKRIIKL